MKKDLSEEEENFSSEYIDRENRCVYIFGAIDSRMAREVCQFIQETNKSIGMVTVYINSSGGNVADMLSIMASFKQSTNEIITDITGEAASAAAFIALSGKYVRMYGLGSMMFHTFSFASEGKMEDIDDVTKSAKRTYGRIVKYLLKDRKLTAKEFYSKVGTRDWWITADEAKKYGFIHEIY
jgi:ATP-dependent Clp protease protease subunit